MTGPPSLMTMTMLSEQRHAELQAQAARDQLARLAQGKANNRQQQWADLTALVVVMAVALLFAAGIAAV
jgi:hypothetical protein